MRRRSPLRVPPQGLPVRKGGGLDLVHILNRKLPRPGAGSARPRGRRTPGRILNQKVPRPGADGARPRGRHTFPSWDRWSTWSWSPAQGMLVGYSTRNPAGKMAVPALPDGRVLPSWGCEGQLGGSY